MMLSTHRALPASAPARPAPGSLRAPRALHSVDHRSSCSSWAGLRRMARARTGARSIHAAASEPVTAVSDAGLPRDAVVGVLGGGQLGRMMALAAGNLGVTIKCLDPTEEAPAAVASHHTVGHFRDAEAVKQFVSASGASVITTEIEHINVDALEAVQRDLGVDVEPSPASIRIIQDKYAQKVHFQAAGVPLGAFAEVSSEEQLQAAAQKFGFPLMLKTRRLAYDGRGNFVVRSAADLAAGVSTLGGLQQGLYAEQWQPFVKEMAVMVVRSRDGSVLSYPVVETIHRDNICHVTEAPADVPPAVAQRAKDTAETAVRALSGAGIFGVEMFLLPDGSVKLNEVAPRPHNSGHYTQDGCVTSQFENHLRAILGWPLGQATLNCGSSLMLNILGEDDGDAGVRLAHELMRRAYLVPGAKVHWYGKAGMRTGRKVGHINIVAPDRAEGRRRLSMIDPSAAAALAATSSSKASTAAASSSHGIHTTGAQVGIIMGSDSDLPTMKAAAQVLEEFGVPCEVTVVSAHRTPERMMAYAHSAHARGVKCIIAGAGGAAHLPGMVAAMTPLPVIGVPVKPAGSHLDGVDALLSICQMPRGVPVATVAIGNATNAGLLAVRILASADPSLLQRMLDYQEGMKQTVLGKAEKLETQGWQKYELK